MKKKRIVSGVLAVLTVFACTNAGFVHGGGGYTCLSAVNSSVVSVSANAADSISADHFKYTVKTDNTLTITGYDLDGANGYSTLEPIKDEDGKTIGYKMVIPSEIEGAAVTEIKSSAFSKYTQLAEVVIPSSVKIINSYAFKDCPSLSSVTLNNGLERIEADAFSGSVITKIDIPCTLTSGSNAFRGCAELTEVNFLNPDEDHPDALAAIPNFLFSNVSSLTAIEIPESVTEIGASAFIKTGLTEVVIPKNVKTVGSYAFQNCPNLSSVTLNNGLEKIGSEVFSGSAITKIDIPCTLTSGNDAFSGCTELAEVNFLVPDEEHPDALAAIPQSLFRNVSSLTTIAIPESVTEIGSSAFYKTGLTEVVIPKSVKTIGAYAFQNCPNLSSVTLNNGLEKIGTEAFAASVITRIDIPCTLTSGDCAFRGCAELAEVNFLAPDEEYPDALAAIPASLFREVPSLTAVEIPESVTEIGSSAFNKTGLTEVVIPKNVKTIGSYAFQNCPSLSSVTLNKGLEKIGTEAFYGSVITSIHIPCTLTSGSNAFVGCSKLSEVTFEEGVYAIPNGLFNNCTGLTELTLPATVDTIGNYAFSGCTNLKKITIPDAYCHIENYATQKTPCTIYSYADANADASARTVQNYAAKNNHAFESLGDYTAPDPYYGDVNKDGSVDILDVISVNKAVLGKETLTWQQTERADVDKSSKGTKTDSNDSLNILKYIVGLISGFDVLIK